MNRENTRYTTEGGWYECDKVRFRQGNPEKIGGWTQYSANTFLGICRSLWNWATLGFLNLIGVGTNLKFYILRGSAYYDVTPIRATSTINNNPFALTASPTVTVTDTNHGCVTGDFVTFSGAVDIGGAGTNVTAAVLNQEFQVTVLSTNTYTITLPVTPNATAIAGSPGGGASVVAAYQLNVGPEYQVPQVGWGAGTWGSGTWGFGTTSLSSLRLWNQINYGEDLVFGPRGGGLYYWDATNGVTTRGVALNTLGGTVTFTAASPTVVTATILLTEGAAIQFNTTGTMPLGVSTGTTYYVFDVDGLTFKLLDSAGAVVNTASVINNNPFALTASPTVTVTDTAHGFTTGDYVTFSGAVDIGAAGTNVTAAVLNQQFQITVLTANTYTITLPVTPNATAIAGSPGGGSAVSAGITGTGVYISDLVDVPVIQNNLTVSDTSRFIIVFGTNDYGSTAIDPMLIRWSNQDDPYNWTPNATNQAGSIRLSHGSEIITHVQTRQEILVFTDTSVYSLQYLGPPYVWQSQLLGDNISIVSPNSAIIASGVVYWMGVDKFYMYDGRVQTLNCDLRRFVFSSFNQQQSQQVFCGTNEGYNEVWWFYPSANSTTVDRYVVYNYLENIWYYGTMARTAWLDSGLLDYPIAAAYNHTLLNHENGINDEETGTPVAINAYISSSEFDIGDGHNFGFVWRVLPDLTFENATNAPNGDPAQVTMTLYGLQNSGSGVTSTAGKPVSKGATYVITEEFTGQIYTRIRGRQMIFKVESDQINTTWQLGAPRIDIRQDGRR